MPIGLRNNVAPDLGRDRVDRREYQEDNDRIFRALNHPLDDVSSVKRLMTSNHDLGVAYDGPYGETDPSAAQAAD